MRYSIRRYSVRGHMILIRSTLWYVNQKGGSQLFRAFGATVRVLRNEIGVSQESFADSCGLDRTYISLIERGIRNPTIKTVWTVAEALGKRPSELLVRVEQELGER